LGDTILVYTGTTINLHAGGGYKEYTWSTGSADSVISVTDQGNYWSGLRITIAVLIRHSLHKGYQYFIPNAFTPNGDGKNDIFRVLGQYRNIRFNMYIYDRWGQLMFHSENIDEGWDGTYKNNLCMSGTYTWLINIDFLARISSPKEVSF